MATAFSTASSRSRRGLDVAAGVAQDVRRLVGVRADDAHHHGHVALLLRARLDQAARDLVAARDAAEDVDQDRLHRLGRRG